MIDFGKMNADFTTGRDEQIIAMMNKTLQGRDITDRFFSNPEPVIEKEPIVNFNKWQEMYTPRQEEQVVQQSTPTYEQQVIPVEEKKSDFDFNSWMNELNGLSVKNDQQPKATEPIQEQVITQNANVNPFEEALNNSYTVIGQAAQKRGYDPNELVDMAQKISADDLIDLYEMRKYQEQMRNSKPQPGPSIIGDPSNYKQQSNSQFVAGYGAKNVRI